MPIFVTFRSACACDKPPAWERGSSYPQCPACSALFQKSSKDEVVDLSELSDETDVLRELTDRTGEAWIEIELRVAALAGRVAAASATGSPSPPVDRDALVALAEDLEAHSYHWAKARILDALGMDS